MDSRHTPSYSVESLKILCSYFFKRKSKKEIKRRGDGREERRADEQEKEGGEGSRELRDKKAKQQFVHHNKAPFSLAWLE